MPALSPTWTTKRCIVTYRNPLTLAMEAGIWELRIVGRITNTLADGTKQVFRDGKIGAGSLSTVEGSPSFDQTVPIVDDPDNTPQGGELVLTVTFATGGSETFRLSPLNAWPATTDLATILNPEVNPSAPPVVMIGVAGGVAALDADGDVVNSAGAKVTGGGGSTTLPFTLAAAPTGVAATDRAEIAGKMAAMATLAKGGIVQLQVGTYLTDQKLTVPGGVELRGSGHDYSGFAPGRGTTIKAASGLNTIVVALGSDTVSFLPGDSFACLSNMNVDANNIANSAIQTVARRCVVSKVYASRGTLYTVDMSGQNSRFEHSIANGNSVSCSIRVAAADVKITNSELREGSTEQIRLDFDYTGCEIVNNHMYGVSPTGSNRCNIRIYAGSERSVKIVGNTIEATAGHLIRINQASGDVLSNLTIASNVFYQNSVTTNTYSVIYLNALGMIRGTISSNSGGWANGGTGKYFKAFIEQDSAGTNELTVYGNHISDCNAMFVGMTPMSQGGNIINNASGTFKSDNGGRVTFAGNGSTTAFAIPHGLAVTPVRGQATPESSAAAAPFYLTRDATNLTVNFTTAPANAASIVLSWSASATGAVVVSDVTAPTVPGTPTATAGTGQISLTWTVSTDTVGVTGYRVYRSDAPTTVVASPATNSYTDATATVGTAYTYTVDAVDAAGNTSAKSASSNSATATGDTTAPTVPGTPVATGGANQIGLTWTASTDAVGVTGYRVYRSDAPTISIASPSPGTNSYTDTTAVVGTAYTYTVAAIDAAGNLSAKSASSNSATATAGVTNFINDTFTGHGTNLESRSADTGGAWSKNTAAPGTAILETNRLRANTTTTTLYVLATATPPSADYTVEADFVMKSAVAASTAGILLRASSTAITYYGFRYSVPSGNWAITKQVAGTGSSVASYATLVPTVDQVYHLKLTVSGTTLTAYIDGTQVATGTDSAITGAGLVGITFTGAAGTGSTGLHLDNLTAHA